LIKNKSFEELLMALKEPNSFDRVSNTSNYQKFRDDKDVVITALLYNQNQKKILKNRPDYVKNDKDIDYLTPRHLKNK
jgi:hypothetical protein